METTTERAAARSARPGWVPFAILVLGVSAASVSAILIRYATEADALAISFWRCAVGAAVLLPFARFRRRGLDAPTLRYSIVAGAFLALHFATWISSVELTTVAASVLLVSTTPVFTALVARWLFSERLGRAGWLGIWFTLAGVALIGGADLTGSSGLGNLLALIGGAAAAGYLLGGVAARRTLGIIEYAVVAYAVSAVILLPICILAGVGLGGFSAQTWWAIAGLVVGPQLLGHTVINLTLRELDATTVSVTIMAEPLIATALAFVLLSEVPSALVYPGGVLILIGIFVVTRVRQETAVAPE